ncbi:MAG TPA: Crp/Fnr family transcriptional regulator [Pyrinomonadaceae bacterium]|nr:Crp/Fnr family transcriptional regulator [Pyrinomonadaceae bacterium]
MAYQHVDRLEENRLLAAFPSDLRERLRSHAEVRSLEHGFHAITPDEPIRDVYFPLNCLLSMVTTMSDGQMVESGTIGREGLSGLPVLLNAGQTTMPTFVQIPGSAVRLAASVMKAAYEESPEVRALLNRYAHTVIVVGSQSTACNALHRVEARMARWLLMSNDGTGSDDLNLTQEYLAAMLGVRRAGVTEITVKLKAVGIIEHRRGAYRIIDREGLERMACECYGRVRGEYERLFGVAG